MDKLLLPKLGDSFDRIDVCAVEDENASSFE